MDLNLHTPPIGPANADKLKERLARDGQELLSNTINELKEERVKMLPLIKEGLPHQEICDAARHSDLIVIGKNRRNSFWKLFSRRTVQAVVEEATCPVLVV
jgi:nucleotide-binding universal stress UspA family protein